RWLISRSVDGRTASSAISTGRAATPSSSIPTRKLSSNAGPKSTAASSSQLVSFTGDLCACSVAATDSTTEHHGGPQKDAYDHDRCDVFHDRQGNRRSRTQAHAV